MLKILPVMMKASTGKLNPLDEKKVFTAREQLG
jgi:hypothetical protein